MEDYRSCVCKMTAPSTISEKWQIENNDATTTSSHTGERDTRPLTDSTTDRAASAHRLWRVSAVMTLLLLGVLLRLRHLQLPLLDMSTHGLMVNNVEGDAQGETPLLEVFEVHPPILSASVNRIVELDSGHVTASDMLAATPRLSCHATLVVHSFAFSYGRPFVATYNPPPNCSFNRVTWNLTVLSAGRQFDRIGIVFLGDIEVFRTSTAEPTAAGIRWTYLKDMTNYLALFKQQQKIIFDLGNLIDDTYTGAFNVTLTASYFIAQEIVPPADTILPVSSRRSSFNASSVFALPSDTAASDLILPRNVVRAVFTIAAAGQSAEEFWWSNVPSSFTQTFPETGSLYGQSPFREVQLYIDGNIAGVAWPFPVIFTGGVVPGLWRPVVGIDAFDLKEDEIDITPWLPLLCNGRSHTFEVRVSGLGDEGNGTTVLSELTGNYWLVSGKVFIWLDAEGFTTTGTMPELTAPASTFELDSYVGQGPNDTNHTLSYHVVAHRRLEISATVITSRGSKQATWQQTLDFTNRGIVGDGGSVQLNEQITNSSSISSSGYRSSLVYGLSVTSAFSTCQDNITIQAIVNRTKDVETIGHSVFPTGLESFSAALQFMGAALSTTQNGSATYMANSTSRKSSSFGFTQQHLLFSGINTGASVGNEMMDSANSTELFRRSVTAVNGTVVEDSETLTNVTTSRAYLAVDHTRDFPAQGINGMLGRGPD